MIRRQKTFTSSLPNLSLGAPLVFALVSTFSTAHALDLDWTGQFRAENHWIYNSSLARGNTTNDATKTAAEGYYVPGSGQDNIQYQHLFLRLKPSVVVNDNIYVKSEWWVGDPVYGFFGGTQPHGVDNRQFYSTGSRGSLITAQRMWGEFLSEFGTFKVGRQPLHWGLGLVWNSGDGMWDRYLSTGDAIRLVSKFGAFTFAPGVIKYSTGNSVGGSCPTPSSVATPGTPCTTSPNGGSMIDYSLMLKYDNPDEDIEMGVNFVRRIAGNGQDTTFGYNGVAGAPSGMVYNTWDIFGRKSIGDFTFAGEIPITTGEISGAKYNTYAVALETKWDISETWETSIKAGSAPGQPNTTETAPGQFKAFFFHPNYKLGMIMFNYQFYNFAGPHTQNNPNLNGGNMVSPYDHPIVNARYLHWNGGLKTGKWRFDLSYTYGLAHQTAQGGTNFYNTWLRKYVAHSAGSPNQDNNLGWEVDLGTEYRWDESFLFGIQMGMFFPGNFYRFSNTPEGNAVSNVFATQMRLGVSF